MNEDTDIPEYDHLDVLVNRLMDGGGMPGDGGMPVPTVALTGEMVEFYKTPARVVVELAERVNWGPEDVFFDLGSGLGQVVVLVNVMTPFRGEVFAEVMERLKVLALARQIRVIGYGPCSAE